MTHHLGAPLAPLNACAGVTPVHRTTLPDLKGSVRAPLTDLSAGSHAGGYRSHGTLPDLDGDLGHDLPSSRHGKFARQRPQPGVTNETAMANGRRATVLLELQHQKANQLI